MILQYFKLLRIKWVNHVDIKNRRLVLDGSGRKRGLGDCKEKEEKCDKELVKILFIFILNKIKICQIVQ